MNREQSGPSTSIERETAEALRDTALAKLAAALAEKAAAEAKRQQAESEAETAELAKDKARAEFDEWKQQSSLRQRDAELKTEAARLANLASLQSAVATATPDLSGVQRGETTAPADKVLFSALLRARALNDAASKVVAPVKAHVGNRYRVFVTADPDLRQRDALYGSLKTRLSMLNELLATFLLRRDNTKVDLAGVDPLSVGFGIATAAAKLLPGVLSLVSANRALAAQDLTLDETEVIMAVGGALALAEGDDTVVMDSMAFLPDTSVVGGLRNDLEKAAIELHQQMAVEKIKPATEQDADWLAEATSLAVTAKEFLTFVDTVPAGSAMSPIAAAMALEAMRAETFNAILVVTPAGASATQLINDKALAAKDPIHAMASASLAYSLLNPRTSQVIAGGIVSGHAQLAGQVGSTIEVAPR